MVHKCFCDCGRKNQHVLTFLFDVLLLHMLHNGWVREEYVCDILEDTVIWQSSAYWVMTLWVAIWLSRLQRLTDGSQIKFAQFWFVAP